MKKAKPSPGAKKGSLNLTLLALVLVVVAIFSQKPVEEDGFPLVTLQVQDVTLAEALESVASQLDLEVIPVRGEPEDSCARFYDFVDEPAEHALNKVTLNWKVVGNLLLNVPGFMHIPFGAGRMEFLLEEAPAPKLLPILEAAYPQVLFYPHPTMNGFYCNGCKEELLSIKHQLASLDQNPIPPHPEVTRSHRAQWFTVWELQAVINKEFPTVEVSTDGEKLRLHGPLAKTGQAQLALLRYDRKVVKVAVSLENLRTTRQHCDLKPHGSAVQVACRPDCRGPLQLTGLKNGDILRTHTNADLRMKPEWWVERNGKDYRILLEISPLEFLPKTSSPASARVKQ